MKYGIWCEVSGGVTGHRASWLRVGDQVAEFDTFDEANAEAERLQSHRNADPHRTALFRYEPMALRR